MLQANDWTVRGFSEALIYTGEITPWLAFLQGLGGWHLIHRGSVPRQQQNFQGHAFSATAEEWLFTDSAGSGRYLRLCQFNSSDCESSCQRDLEANCWDTGGIFDLNVRINKASETYAALQKLGWQAISEPIPWRFGHLEVIEWLSKGPDGAIFAFIERLDPPIANGNFNGFSGVFNSSQIVSDIDRAELFYQQLGFQRLAEHSGPLPGQGGRVLGLTSKEARQTRIDIRIMHPEAEMNGSIELVSINKPGVDLSAKAVPPNLGIAGLRFAVTNIKALARHLDQHSLTANWQGIFKTCLNPYGQVKLLAVQSPEGARLEFFESQSKH